MWAIPSKVMERTSSRVIRPFWHGTRGPNKTIDELSPISWSYGSAAAPRRRRGRPRAQLHARRRRARRGAARLSQSVAALERELGLALFERSSRRVRPTDAGAALVFTRRGILAHVEALRSEMEEHAGAVRGRVVVGSIQLFSETVLPSVLAGFHLRHPQVDLVLREDVSHPMLATLGAAELDLAIVNVDDPSAYPEFTFETLYRDELAIAAGPGHALAAERSTTLEALRDADGSPSAPARVCTRRSTMRRAAAASFRGSSSSRATR